MTSLEIAELTGKLHNDVLKAIRKMEPAWMKVNGGNFSLVEYKDSKGELRPCYSLTKNDSIFERLDIQFTTEQAMQQSVAVKGAGEGCRRDPQHRAPDAEELAQAGLVVLEEDGNYRKL